MATEPLYGALTNHNLISCIGDLSPQDFDDLTDCKRIATTSADLVRDRYADSRIWLEEYARTLIFLGWTLHAGAITTKTRSNITGSIADFLVRSTEKMNIPQGNAMIDTLDALSSDTPAMLSLDRESHTGHRFQVVPARYDAKGELHMAIFNLELVASAEKSSFMFWPWEQRSAMLIQQSAFFKLDLNELNTRRALMEKKLRENTAQRFTLRKRPKA